MSRVDGQQSMLTQPLTPTIRLVNFGPGLTHSIRCRRGELTSSPFFWPATQPPLARSSLTRRGAADHTPLPSSRAGAITPPTCVALLTPLSSSRRVGMWGPLLGD